MLFFGNTASGDVFFERELAELGKDFPGLSVHHCVVQPDAGWDGEVGLVTDVLSARIDDPASHAYYLCGPPPMIAATRALLSDKGVPADQIFEENFLPSGNQES